MFRILWSVALIGIVTCETLYFEPKDSSQGITCPDKQSRCPEESSCCLLPSGQYGCCPLKKAVCCSDRLHCCPEGATCDTQHKRCNQNGILIPWFEKSRSTPVAPTASVLVCPDQVSSCPTYAICCPLSSGFGCCPIRKGVCCSDGQHCCPQGYSCNIPRATCTKKDSPVIMWQAIVKTSSLKAQSQAKAGQASSSKQNTKATKDPSRVSQSSSSGSKVTGQTVSKSSPQEKRTVTAPGKQAPPAKAQQQKVQQQKLPTLQKSQSTTLKSQKTLQKTPPPKQQQTQLKQPTQQKTPTTPTTQTTNQKQKTPLKQAATPPKQPTQQAKQVSKPPPTKESQKQAPPQVNAQKSQKLQQAKPPQKSQIAKQVKQEQKVLQKSPEQPNAKVVPQQQKSQSKAKVVTQQQKPQQTAKQVPVHAKENAAKEAPKQNAPAQGKAKIAKVASKAKPKEERSVKNVVGGIMAKMVSKVKEFVKKNLIADDIDTGDLHKPIKQKATPVASAKTPSKAKTPEKKGNIVSKSQSKTASPPPTKQADGLAKRVLQKLPVQTSGSAKAKHPSQKSTQALHSKQAPKVKQAETEKSAKTKSSGQQNTPSNPKSNPGKGNVNPGQKAAEAIKQRTLSSSQSVKQKPQGGKNVEVTCADKSRCPPATTCCQLPSGAYGCCPMPSAICCTDGVHCCPQGYQCDAGKGQCMKTGSHNLNIIKMLPTSETPFERLKAAEVPVKKSALKSGASKLCPDQRSMCSSDATCCQMPTGAYGCCPIEKATCCSDRQHCCPEGYACDPDKQKCTKNNLSVSWSKKEPAKAANFKPGGVICPDQKSKCDDGNTCCKLKSGDWGCCPLPKAVCCPDQLHCCPEGTKCTSLGVCERPEAEKDPNTDSIAWFKKVPASAVGSIQCPGNDTKCPDQSTCCKLSIGGYGCCPLIKAVCCADGLHCCPNGYSCNSKQGTCTKGNQDALKTSNLFIRKGTKDGH